MYFKLLGVSCCPGPLALKRPFDEYSGAIGSDGTSFLMGIIVMHSSFLGSGAWFPVQRTLQLSGLLVEKLKERDGAAVSVEKNRWCFCIE